MLSFMGCMVVLKPLFPMVLAKIKWTKFYGVLGACAVGGICLVLANMIAVEFDVMRIRPDIELFLWIPFIAAYLLNKPRKAAFWNGAAIAMLASFAFGSFMTDNTLSTSYLLQLVIMAAAVIITELIRDKGRAWQMMVPIGLAAIACFGIVVWYSGGISSMLSPEENWSVHWWSNLSQHCLAWNHLHRTMRFPQAVDAYLAYEAALLEKLKERWDMLRKKYAAIGPEQKESGFYKTADYYHKLCETLWTEASAWQSPLSLRQQDELQRWIVLLAHEERSLQEAEAKQDAAIAARNRDTRRSKERGTKLCENLIRKCCEKDTWKGAVEGYLEGSLPAIGEACWRAASKIMRAYSESGR